MTDLRAETAAVRRLLLEAALAAGTCHIGSALSVVEILTVLGFRHPDSRVLLSKGHAASALYAVLARTGALPEDEVVRGYCSDGGSLPGHPERGIPGVELTAGSLGHGPAVALGLALGDPGRRVFCVVGDGELDEGSVWEAVALAGRVAPRGLTIVVDANGFQGLGPVADAPFAERFRAFGWAATEVDGHDVGALERAFAADGGRPTAIVARTVKGKGVPALEGEFISHYRSFRPHERALLLGDAA